MKKRRCAEMFAEFKHTIHRLRGQAIGWSIGMAFYSLLLGSFYDTVAAMEGLDELLQGYPPEMLAFFGNMTEMTTPWGYLDVEYFTLINMIIGIFAIGVCVNLIVGDEEKGLLDLVLAHPISRTRLFWGRLLAFLTVIALILLIAWLSLVIPSNTYGFDLSPVEFSRPFLSLFAISIFFSTIALLLSLILPSARLAGMISGAIMVFNFLLLGLSNINTDLEPFMKYTPMYYYQGGEAIKGLEWEWVFGLLTVSLLFAVLSWIPFLKRDIRVSGEHSWRLPKIKLTRQAEEEITEVEKPLMEQVHWVVILLVALAFIVIFCILPLIVIEVSDQWCSLFAGIFNSISPGVCP